MSKPEKPSSSAGSPIGDLRVEVEPELPAPPGVFSFLSLTLSGAGTFIASTLVAGCVFAPYFKTFSRSRELFGYLVFGAMTSVLLFVAYQSWRAAYKRTDKLGDRWVGLSLPVFAGAGLIFAVVMLSRMGDWQTPRPVLNRMVCHFIIAEDPDEETRCVALADGCQTSVLEHLFPLPTRYEALQTCLTLRRAGKPYPPPPNDSI